MAYEIETKDGIVIRGIPDNVKPDDASIKAKVANARFKRDAESPDRRKAGEMALEGMGTMGRAVAGYGAAIPTMARGVGQLLGLVGQKEVTEAKERDQALTGSGAGLVGNVAGNIAPALVTALIPGANTVTGAAAIGAGMGAIQPVAEGESRGANAAMGGIAGAGGQLLGQAVGRAIKPVQSTLAGPKVQLAQRAEQLGIPLDAADKTGSRVLQVARSVMESMPATADKQAAIQQAKRVAFNRATLNEIGEAADYATPEVLKAARDRIGGVFQDISSRNSVTLADDFMNSLAKIDASRTPFSSPTISSAVDKGLDLAAKGKISGVEYQKVRTVLGKASTDAFRSGNSELGQALKAIRSGLDEAANSSIAVADKDAWRVARQQWQALKVLEKAAAPTSADAVSGNVSAAKLAQALKSVDPQGYIYGTRQGDLGDLARIGQAFVKEQIPNSGTAERTLMQKVLNNPLEAIWHGTTGGIGRPLQAAMNSTAGQAYLTQGLKDLTPRQLAIANALARSATGGSAYAAQQ